jgi:hypothetical protein
MALEGKRSKRLPARFRESASPSPPPATKSRRRRHSARDPKPEKEADGKGHLGDNYYVVEEIFGARRRGGEVHEFEVKWAGYSTTFNSFVRPEDVCDSAMM